MIRALRCSGPAFGSSVNATSRRAQRVSAERRCARSDGLSVERGRFNYNRFDNFQRGTTFSPDHRRVLILTYPDVPCIWDVDKGGEPALVLRGHTDEVHFARFSSG